MFVSINFNPISAFGYRRNGKLPIYRAYKCLLSNFELNVQFKSELLFLSYAFGTVLICKDMHCCSAAMRLLPALTNISPLLELEKIMILRYPTTSYAASYEDLTGGYMVRFENALINAAKAWSRKRKLRAELSSLSDRELNDIGINHGDIDAIIDGTSDMCKARRGFRS